MLALWSMDKIFIEEDRNERKEKVPGSISQMDEWLTWKEMQVRFYDEPEFKNLKLCF